MALNHNLVQLSVKDACEMLVDYCHKNSLSLAGFSMHDYNVIVSVLGYEPELEYINVHKIGKRWINRNYYSEYRDHCNSSNYYNQRIKY